MALRTPALEDPAARTVGAYLGEQVRELEARESQVRRDVPDSLHKMRVAIRRLRSALATYRPLLDRSVSDPLRDELRWLAGVLGEVRDAEVMLERLTSILSEWDGREASSGAAGDRLVTHLEEARRTGQVHVAEVLDDGRYARLLTSLEVFVADPPWRPVADRPAREVLPGRVDHAWRRLRDLARAAARADPSQRAARMHEVRKAAKRTRYAAESLVPLYGDPARRLAQEMTALQDVLGAHQDSVVAEQLATELGVPRLCELERDHQAEYQRRYAEVWHSASRKRLRRWLAT